MLPDIVNELIEEIAKLPGIGPKSASRIVFHYLDKDKDSLLQLSKLLNRLSEEIQECQECGNYSDSNICKICSNPKRSRAMIMIIEDQMDSIPIEELGVYQGMYHVLKGLISPVNGVGPEDLRIFLLKERIQKYLQNEECIEVVFALTPGLEGEATAMYIKDYLSEINNIIFTTFATGLPSGAELDYTDKLTLKSALEGRVKMK